MKFAREIVTLPLLKEFGDMFLAHHLEVSHFPEMVLDPDPNQYVKAEEAGMLRWFTMRDNQGEAMGYFTFFVTPWLHHVRHIQAHQGLLFIKREQRGKWFEQFCDYACESLVAEGVEKIYVHANPKNNLHLWFERKGMELIDRTYEVNLTCLENRPQEPAMSKTGDY